MATNQSRSKRKETGGRYKNCVAKKLHAKGSLPTLTKLGETKVKIVEARGSNNVKQKLASSNVANLYDRKTKKYAKSAIKTIAESPANMNYVRRNIITKGAIIETEAGKAKVTSRPGQDGAINAVLI